MICMDDPRSETYCNLAHQLASLGKKLEAAKKEENEDKVKKYQYQIKTTVVGMQKVIPE